MDGTDNSKVVELNTITKLDIPPDRVLQNNIGAFRDVVLMGYDHDGKIIFASSKSDAAEVLLLIERVKRRLLDGVEEVDQ